MVPRKKIKRKRRVSSVGPQVRTISQKGTTLYSIKAIKRKR